MHVEDLAELKGERRYSQAWADWNPKLGANIIGQEIDTGKIKIGDGVSRWNDLDYFSGGGSAGGGVGPTLYKKTINFDTPNLQTGVDFLDLGVGDIVLDAWVEVDTAWDGTTPHAQMFLSDDGDDYLLHTPRDLTTTDYSSAGKLLGGPGGSTDELSASEQTSLTPWRQVPAKVVAAESLKIGVSTNGNPSGTATGSTVGSLIAYALVVSAASVVDVDA